jgi:hypothetical protein
MGGSVDVTLYHPKCPAGGINLDGTHLDIPAPNLGENSALDSMNSEGADFECVCGESFTFVAHSSHSWVEIDTEEKIPEQYLFYQHLEREGEGFDEEGTPPPGPDDQDDDDL